MKILYISLFPEKPLCNEIANLEYFQTSSLYYNIEDLFTYRLFSCHKEMCKGLRDSFDCGKYSQKNLFDFTNRVSQVEQLFFDAIYTERMDERRAHEIGWSKQKIHNFINRTEVLENFDYIFYNDADIRIDANDVYELCKVLEIKQDSFINIPYVLKIEKQVVDGSFGSFILSTKLLYNMQDVTVNLYDTYEEEDKIFRKQAPDWALRKILLKSGYTEIRGESCHTQHYINGINYYDYDSRKLNYY
jgi:hypothetical protein